MRLYYRDLVGWRHVDLIDALGVAIDAAGGVEIGVPVDGARAVFVASTESGRPRAALVCPPGAGLTVNGFAPLGVAVLEDRDEIGVEGQVVRFAAFRPPAPAPFPGLGGELPCPRCKRVLCAGDMVSLCPLCRAAHHEGALATPAGAERRCFSYDRCASCFRHVTELIWSPGEGEEGHDD